MQSDSPLATRLLRTCCAIALATPLVLTAVACATNSSSLTPGSPSTSAAIEPSTPSEPPASTAPSTGAPPPGDCSDQQATEGLATITGQIQAISAADYAGALTFSSRDYRAGVTPESFGAIIESDYTLLTTDPRVRLQRCQRTDEGALVLDIDVIGATSSAQMRYALVREQGRWLIRVAGLIGGSLELPA